MHAVCFGTGVCLLVLLLAVVSGAESVWVFGWPYLLLGWLLYLSAAVSSLLPLCWGAVAPSLAGGF